MNSRTQEQKISEVKIATNHGIRSTLGAIDLSNISVIFTLNTATLLKLFLENFGKFAFFSIAAIANLGIAAIEWRQAYLEKGKNGTLPRAVVETLAALAITTAVVGSFVAPMIFGFFGPLIFSITLGIKAIFHAASSFYYFGKAAGTVDPEKRSEYFGKAKDNVVAAVLCAVASACVVGVMLIGKALALPSAIIGAVAGAFGAGYAIYKTVLAVKKVQQKKREALAASEVEPVEIVAEKEQTNNLSQGAKLARALQGEQSASAATRLSSENKITDFPSKNPTQGFHRSHSCPELSVIEHDIPHRKIAHR